MGLGKYMDTKVCGLLFFWGGGTMYVTIAVKIAGAIAYGDGHRLARLHFQPVPHPGLYARLPQQQQQQ